MHTANEPVRILRLLWCEWRHVLHCCGGWRAVHHLPPGGGGCEWVNDGECDEDDYPNCQPGTDTAGE